MPTDPRRSPFAAALLPVGRRSRLGSPLITLLVEAYEAEHQLGPPPGGLDAVRYLVEQNGMTASQLSELLGDASRSLGGRVLRGERALSKAHFKTLCERFAVSADLFL